MTPEQVLSQLNKLLAAEPELLPFLVRLSKQADLLLQHLGVGSRAELMEKQRETGGERSQYLASLAERLLVRSLEFSDGVVDSSYSQRWKLSHSATQSTTSGVDLVLAWDGEVLDTDEVHDTVTSNTDVNIRTEGEYIVGANVVFAVAAGGARRLQLLINGTVHSTTTIASAGAVLQTGLNNVNYFSLSKGDILTVRVQQDSGGALNVVQAGQRNPTFWGKRVA